MNRVVDIAGALLGIGFVFFGIMYFVKFASMPPPPQDGSAMAMFSAAMAMTGYMKFVKILEIAGGILAAIPKTRPVGLLILTPIIINIIAFHAFITAGSGLLDPMIIGIVLLDIFLIWSHRRGLAALVQER